MSHLLEVLGQGLPARLMDIFDRAGGTAAAGPGAPQANIQPHAPTDGANSQLGWDQLRQESYDQAAESFASALKRDPDHVPSLVGMACHQAETGRLESAVDCLCRAAERQDGSRIRLALGICFERLERQAEAIPAYQRAVAHDENCMAARQRLAAIALQQGRDDEAIRHYEALREIDFGNVAIRCSLAALYLRAGEPRKAVIEYETALTIEPDNWQAHDDLVASLEQAGMYREAIEQLQTAAEEMPEEPEIYVRLADLHAKVGEPDTALEYYRESLRLHPDFLEAAVKLGTQYLRMGQFCDAAQWFNQAVEINDKMITAYVGLGIAQERAGQTEAAIGTLELAAALEPNTTLLFSEMARLQLKAALGQATTDLMAPESLAPAHQPDGEAFLEQQMQRHAKALEASPNHADLHYRYGLLLKSQGKVSEAAAAFEQAVKINPNYVKALLKWGLTLKEQGYLDKAIDVFKRALQAEPHYVDLHYHLGLMYCDKTQFALAVEHFEQAAEANPVNASIRANLALALQNMGLVDRAAAQWKSICELAPESPMAYQAERQLKTLGAH